MFLALSTSFGGAKDGEMWLTLKVASCMAPHVAKVPTLADGREVRI